MLSNNWGIETLIGLPVALNVTADGLGSLGIEDAATVDVLPLAISIQYYPTMGDSPFQPYVGFGLNYTIITNPEVDDSVISGLMAEDVDFSFDNSSGFNLNVGVDWKFHDKWFANASIYYLTIATDIEADITQSAVLGGLIPSPPIDATLETSIDANSFVYYLTGGYRF